VEQHKMSWQDLWSMEESGSVSLSDQHMMFYGHLAAEAEQRGWSLNNLSEAEERSSNWLWMRRKDSGWLCTGYAMVS